jgi:hypothetical protein
MDEIINRVRQVLKDVGHADQVKMSFPFFFQCFQRCIDCQPIIAAVIAVRFAWFDANRLAMECIRKTLQQDA